MYASLIYYNSVTFGFIPVLFSSFTGNEDNSSDFSLCLTIFFISTVMDDVN